MVSKPPLGERAAQPLNQPYNGHRGYIIGDNLVKVSKRGEMGMAEFRNLQENNVSYKTRPMVKSN